MVASMRDIVDFMAVFQAMGFTATLASSALVAAVVGALISFLTQRWLLERKAQVDYEYAARKRLYEAIGPLRLQLLFAARDVVSRVSQHPNKRWNMKVSEYYSKSFIYRLLRPLAVGHIILRQMNIVDLSIDSNILELLRFDAAVGRMLTGARVVLDHPGVDWSRQSQHLFHDNLRTAAGRLVTSSDSGETVMDYAQFARDIPDPTNDPALQPLAAIFARCQTSLLENPIFWLRLVGYGYACNRLIRIQGKSFGFEPGEFSIDQLLRQMADAEIAGNAAQYWSAFESVATEGL